MFGSNSAERTPESVLVLLRRKHRKLLKRNEVFLAACDCFPIEEAHPPPLTSGRVRMPIDLRSPDAQLRSDAAAHVRVLAIRNALGMNDQEFTELPPSINGYLFAHTDRRLLIFDGSGKRYQLQTPMKGLWLQPIDHGDKTFTLVFTNGDERVAVRTRRDSIDLTRNFIHSFPDRRSQARILNLADAQNIDTF